ncbi:MAG TPA: RNA polymerase sigma factor [Bacteroidales bacterium]|nr:RNA polymerase sigma factor [Bacteroidales bacterium]
MRKVKEGDIDKMGLLYERYYKELFRYLCKVTGKREVSEDLVHNVFFRMLKYRNGFAGTGEFRTWMYHIARNALYDSLKKERRISFHESLRTREFEERLAEEDPAERDREKENELKILESAMAEMPVENRELLVMVRFQELKYAEIAEILSISEGAVKVRVHRAVNQLREIYLGMYKKYKDYELSGFQGNVSSSAHR